LQLSVGIPSKLCSVCEKVATTSPAYFLTHDATVHWWLQFGLIYYCTITLSHHHP